MSPPRTVEARMMSAKRLKFTAGVLAGFVSLAVLAWDQDLDGLTDDMIAPSCRIGSLQSWEGRPCVVPLRTGPADGTATPR